MNITWDNNLGSSQISWALDQGLVYSVGNLPNALTASLTDSGVEQGTPAFEVTQPIQVIGGYEGGVDGGIEQAQGNHYVSSAPMAVTSPPIQV